ncbi:MAG: hypothetical protein ABI469_10400 [Gemmatimonadales bacterium]
MDDGPRKIDDTVELQIVRRQARGVYVKSIITAGILTALTLLLP